MKMSKRFYPVLVIMLVSAALFTACGDPTATTAPATTAAATTAAATTAAATTAATTAAATTVAPTTAPATTVAATTIVATTAPATTVAATTAATTAAATSGSGIPATWKEVTLDPTVIKAISQEIPGNLNVSLKFYGSAEDVTTAATSGDSEFTKAGYKFAIPGQTKPAPVQDTAFGLYTKSGSPDLFFTVTDVATGTAGLASSLKTGGVSQILIDSTIASAKSYKSLVTVITGNGVVQSVLGATSGSSTTTSAAAGTTAATTADSNSLGLYPGATVLTLPDAVTKQFEGSVGSAVVNPQVAAFSTPDSSDKVKAYYVDLLQKGGWTDITTLAGAGLSQLGSAGGFGLIYSKAKQVLVIISLPAASALALGIPNAPTSGTLVLGFAGEAK